MITVEIKDPSLVLFMIDVHIEGIKDAKDQSIEDGGTLDTVDKMLESMALYDENIATLLDLKEAIINGDTRTEKFWGSCRSIIRSLRKRL